MKKQQKKEQDLTCLDCNLCVQTQYYYLPAYLHGGGTVCVCEHSFEAKESGFPLRVYKIREKNIDTIHIYKLKESLLTIILY